MPGGLDGIMNQLLNIFTRGSGGGTGARGGMPGQSQAQDMSGDVAVADKYDVDRWKRASEPQTTVQQVRLHWEEQKERNRLRNRLKRLFTRKKKKTQEQPEHLSAEETAGLEGGTVDVRPKPPVIRPRKMDRTVANQRKKALVAEFNQSFTPAGICTEFFRGNPVNSAFLAIDELSLDGLALNQIAVQRQFPERLAPPIPLDTAYMDVLREQREHRKYDVKIVP